MRPKRRSVSGRRLLSSAAAGVNVSSPKRTPRGVRFGELTFTPAAALDNKRLPETDLRFGRMMEETL